MFRGKGERAAFSGNGLQSAAAAGESQQKCPSCTSTEGSFKWCGRATLKGLGTG